MSWSELLSSPRAREIYFDWHAAILSTAPLDCDAARDALSSFYAQFMPWRLHATVVAQSPRHALLLASEMPRPWRKSTRHTGPARPNDIIAANLARLGAGYGGLSAGLADAIRTTFDDRLTPALHGMNIWEPTHEDRSAARAAWKTVDARAKAGRKSLYAPDDVRPFQLDTAACIGWLAQDAFLQASPQPHIGQRTYPAFHPALAAMCRACGVSLWLYPHAAILCERPSFLATPEAPAGGDTALLYPDGFAVRVSRGAILPGWLETSPHRLTVKHIDREPNAEIRRIMIERFGAGRYLAECGAEQVSQDETGILWRHTFNDKRRLPIFRRDPLCFVEVVNGTPEPDGSLKHYFLHVPPWMTSAREAVAWTYGLQAAEYHPAVRT